MTSIRWRLFAILLLATGGIWLSAVVWLQHSTRAQIERVLDSRLAEAGHMVSSLLSDQGLAQAVTQDAEGSLALPDFRMFEGGIERQLHCQVWSLRGTLLGQSGGAPQARLAEAVEGFSEARTENGNWRVYTVINHDLGVEIVVGESLNMRENLLADVRAGLLWPIGVIAPLLALAIWLSVGRGLRPLSVFASALAGRNEDNLAPVASSPLPPEIQPMGAALDGLLARLAQARQRERDFIAYAAHELKTPLAGIRTQAQVARAAPDEPVRQHALDQLVGAVDRTARLVGQLLDLARVEDDQAASVATEPLETIAGRVVAGLQDLARSRNIALQINGTASGVAAAPVHLGLALRNVVENAVLAAPAGSVVGVVLSVKGVTVRDCGPGIDPCDLPHITDRFFTGTTSRGSGLGLAIAEAALVRIGWSMTFHRAEPAGQIVQLSGPRGTAGS
ncbi:MAG: sensor histidine kinase N-terminal domain-containing protein [Pararhodobacter sp.]|nr:sensor histidine kinase N-terminal domain-containing protein [Pararhodobacter sp.]